MPIQRSLTRLVTLGAVLVSALVASSSSAAAPPCAGAILQEWLETNRIEKVYPLPCYQAAIDAIPQDIEDYTNVADVIARAFQRAAGRRLDRTPQGPVTTTPPGVVPPVDASSSSSVPVPILVLGVMSLALLGAGGLGYLSRRRREQRGELDG